MAIAQARAKAAVAKKKLAAATKRPFPWHHAVFAPMPRSVRVVHRQNARLTNVSRWTGQDPEAQ